MTLFKYTKHQLHKKDYAHLAIWIISFEAIGLLLGFMTKNNISLWYNHLVKSELTPPAITFSIVWSLLYMLLAVLGWSIWKEQKVNPNRESRNIWNLFVVQMIMNWLWTPIFFQFHWIGFSLAWLIVLTFLNLVLLCKLMNKSTVQSMFYTPYVLWLLFATYLNAVIYWFN